MNPIDREFYPLNDAGNPASRTGRRVIDLRTRSQRVPVSGTVTVTRSTITPQPRPSEYHAGYAAGRRSIDRTGVFLAGYISGVLVAACGIYFGAMLLAGL